MHRGEINCRAELMMIALVAAGALVLAITTAWWVFNSDSSGSMESSSEKGQESASALASLPAPKRNET